MTVKTVRAESLPTSIQIALALADGTTGIGTAHRVGSLVLVCYPDGTRLEVQKDHPVAYSRTLPAGAKVCTVEDDHGLKMRTAKGQWYCKTCRKDSHKRSVARLTGKTLTGLPMLAADERKAETAARLDRLMLIAPRTLTELRDNLLRNIAAADFYPTVEAKTARLAEVAAIHGLTIDQAALIVAA